MVGDAVTYADFGWFIMGTVNISPGKLSCINPSIKLYHRMKSRNFMRAGNGGSYS